jgi:hypothetical protein
MTLGSSGSGCPTRDLIPLGKFGIARQLQIATLNQEYMRAIRSLYALVSRSQEFEHGVVQDLAPTALNALRPFVFDAESIDRYKEETERPATCSSRLESRSFDGMDWNDHAGALQRVHETPSQSMMDPGSALNDGMGGFKFPIETQGAQDTRSTRIRSLHQQLFSDDCNDLPTVYKQLCKEWDDAAKPVITELLSVYEQHWSAISSILPKTTGRAGPVHHKLLGSLQQEFSKANGVVSAIGKMAEELERSGGQDSPSFGSGVTTSNAGNLPTTDVEQQIP